jgi:ferredoxin-NADP reductase
MPEKVARTRASTTIAPDVLVCDFACVEPPALSWRAGQFLSLRCGPATDANPARRSYSIASSPSRGDGFELLVKLLPEGVGSALFEGLRPGDDIFFTGPMGFFVCDLQHAGDAIFCVTGTGIAAALPMIHDALARPAERGRVRMFWGMREESQLYWRERLDAIDHPRFSYQICLSRGPEGRINRHVMAALPGLEKPVFYLVGNGAMVRELKTALVAAGVDRKRQIRQEIFYPETPA